jgi:hypothetical protein
MGPGVARLRRDNVGHQRPFDRDGSFSRGREKYSIAEQRHNHARAASAPPARRPSAFATALLPPMPVADPNRSPGMHHVCRSRVGRRMLRSRGQSRECPAGPARSLPRRFGASRPATSQAPFARLLPDISRPPIGVGTSFGLRARGSLSSTQAETFVLDASWTPLPVTYSHEPLVTDRGWNYV